MAKLDIIKFDGFPDGKAWVAYKYPGDKFLLGSQLIVGPSQEVLFIKGGVVADVFGPGTHTLSTGNLPILRKLAALPFAGKSPFFAEIVFVNKVSKLDMAWGTATPFQLEDPRYGIIVSIRAHGKYGIRITNASLFVCELMGASRDEAAFSPASVNAYFNSILISYIKSTISAFMIRNKVSFLDVTAFLTDLSRECNNAVAREFERYGIEITNLSIETISPPPSDYENLRKMKEKYALGEHVYAQERKFDLLDKLASNTANPMVSLGMGVATTKEMMGVLRELTQEEPVAPAPVQPAPAPAAPTAPAAPADGIPCPACGAAVPVGQKFCGECGAKMEKKCPTCGKVCGPTQKFCGDCGTKL